MEDLAGEEVNGLTQLLSSVDELQPRKVEELIPKSPPDTYLIYPTGGYHPFLGVPNTLPRYQQKIWPYVKRIKFTEEGRKRRSRSLVRKEHNLSQINAFWHNLYFQVSLQPHLVLFPNWL